MFAPGIRFTTPPPAAPAISSRADVAVIVGCVARRAAALPDALRSALATQGWTPDGPFAAAADALETLLGVPVPIEDWSAFDALYAWDARPAAPGSADLLPTHLGLALRSFFAEGGRKAYVVRTGDPLPLADESVSPDDFAAAKRRLLSWSGGSAPPDAAARVPILPGFDGLGLPADPGDATTWTGAASIYAVDDAAMILLPDLIDLVAGAPEPAPALPEPPEPPEIFKDCAPAAPDLAPEPRVARPDYRAPRLDRAGYAVWARALGFVLDLLGRPRGPAHRRDVMLVGALPLPLLESGFDAGEESWPLAILAEPGIPAPAARLLDADRIGNARLQLGYPWVGTTASIDLPEGLQSPEGALAGLIARRALASGAFRSAAGQETRSIMALSPDISDADRQRGLPGGDADWLGDRLCLIGNRRGRLELLSDATMAADDRWRAGGVSRLMGIVLRGARWLGQELVFEPSGPRTWARIRGSLEAFLGTLFRLGALDGITTADAFTVRCDQTTMTQNDIDAGRAICVVTFTAAYPIQQITVTLALLDPPQPQLQPQAEAA